MPFKASRIFRRAFRTNEKGEGSVGLHYLEMTMKQMEMRVYFRLQAIVFEDEGNLEQF
jgi:hypothetical protein